MVESSAREYIVPFKYKKTFTAEECTELGKAFKSYDKDGNGTMDAKEFSAVLGNLGHSDVTPEQVQVLLKKVDKNDDGVIEWEEFLDMMLDVKHKDKQNFGAAIETGQGASAQLQSKDGTHTYLLEERSMISRSINKLLKADEDLADRLPMDPTSDDLFHVMSDGMILIKLLNLVEDGLIDMRTVNKGKSLNIYKIRENLDLAIGVAKGKVKLVGIGADTFLEKVPHLVLGVMWQIMRIISTKSVSLKECPEIMRLAQGDEELADLNKLSPEELLLRWVNFHLKAQEQPELKNLGKDLADSKALLYVLHNLDSSKCSLAALEEADDLKRAEQMMLNSEAIGVADVCGAEDIVKGNAKVNMIFVSEIFNTKHGLEELTKEEYEAAALLDDDIDASKEERGYRFWINSLGIEDVFVNNLYEEARDGLVILKVIHRINDQVVDWKRVVHKPRNVFDKNANCMVAEDACRKLKEIKLIGVGGKDLVDGNKKNILAIVWQLVRLHYMQLLGSLTEKDLIAWVNETCPDTQIKNFKDPALGDGQILIKMCADIEPRVVNWDLVTKGETEEEKEMNAKYAISIARKLGAVIFLVWEDIPQLNPKMILVFVCALYDLKQLAKQ